VKTLSLKDIGLVLLSPDHRVIGMNESAKRILGSAMQESGKTVFHYYPLKSRPKIKRLLDESRVHPDVSITTVINALNTKLIINVSQVVLDESLKPLYAMTFLEITNQQTSKNHPHRGMMELNKLPIFNKGSLRFLDMRSIYFIRSNGNYCRLFTETGSYYLHVTLKDILERCAGLKFFRVHKCFIVNTDHIQRVDRNHRGHPMIIFDKETVPHVPVARRKMHELKKNYVLLKMSFPLSRQTVHP